MDTVLWDQTAGVYPIQSYRQRFSGYSETPNSWTCFVSETPFAAHGVRSVKWGAPESRRVFRRREVCF